MLVQSDRPKVLLVDDDLSVRNLFQIFLEANGCSVVAASSVAEALRELRAQRFSVALIDIFLGDDNGVDFLKGIISAGTELPVIVISGIGYGEPLFQEALASGAAGAYTKSQPLPMLLAEVQRVLQGRKTRPQEAGI